MPQKQGVSSPPIADTQGPQIPIDKSNTTRKRVSVACEACRSRRRRCDGEQPTCTSCIQRGGECVYKLWESKRKPPSKRYVESLQARIALLEEQLVALGKSVNEDPTISIEEDGEFDEPGDTESVSEPAPRDPVEEITQRAGRLNIGEDGQPHYFGAQSNYHLLHGPIYNVTTSSIANCHKTSIETLLRLGKLIEVPRELQDHLLDLYWRWQNPWTYIVHKESFMKEYESGGYGPHCTPLLLSAMFALSARYSDRIEVRADPADPHTAGDMFAEQAKLLIVYECEVATAATVQAASLLSLRWMSENKEAVGWLYMGMATRMAYNLGLNLDCSEWIVSGQMSENEVEVRNVTWWGCYKLDKLYSLGLGRATTTRTSDITCPEPKLDPVLEFEPWIPWGKGDQELLGAHARSVSTMHYSCQHLRLISEPLEEIYAPNSKLSRNDVENIVARTDVAFNVFYNGLPSHLRLPASSRTPSLPHIYQLHIQFHVMQIQLHRPLIRRRPRGSKSSPKPISTEVDKHLEACRHAATEIARILRMYQFHYTLRLTPVVTVVNTFSAAVIHLMDAASVDEATRKHALRHLHICIVSLSDMGLAWSWSNRALRALQLLAHEWLIPNAVLSHLRQSKTHLQSNPDVSPSPRDTPIQATNKNSYEDQAAGPASARLVSEHSPPEIRHEAKSPRSLDATSPRSAGEVGLGWLLDIDSFGDGLNNLGLEFENSAEMDAWLSSALQQPFSSGNFNTMDDLPDTSLPNFLRNTS